MRGGFQDNLGHSLKVKKLFKGIRMVVSGGRSHNYNSRRDDGSSRTKPSYAARKRKQRAGKTAAHHNLLRRNGR